ncbi:hypothetical protein [Reichenbachiella sp.]|uniref:hypothetical protein n=1 Tax=Reichenbachiella sp. TaxID=2184521 RepID=UPI003B59FB97
MSREETIDLQKLTTKELLIQMMGRVDEMSRDIEGIKRAEEKKTEQQTDLRIEFAKLQTKVRVWGAASGIIAALIIELIIAFLK